MPVLQRQGVPTVPRHKVSLARSDAVLVGHCPDAAIMNRASLDVQHGHPFSLLLRTLYLLWLFFMRSYHGQSEIKSLFPFIVTLTLTG